MPVFCDCCWSCGSLIERLDWDCIEVNSQFWWQYSFVRRLNANKLSFNGETVNLDTGDENG